MIGREPNVRLGSQDETCIQAQWRRVCHWYKAEVGPHLCVLGDERCEVTQLNSWHWNKDIPTNLIIVAIDRGGGHYARSPGWGWRCLRQPQAKLRANGTWGCLEN